MSEPLSVSKQCAVTIAKSVVNTGDAFEAEARKHLLPTVLGAAGTAIGGVKGLALTPLTIGPGAIAGFVGGAVVTVAVRNPKVGNLEAFPSVEDASYALAGGLGGMGAGVIAPTVGLASAYGSGGFVLGKLLNKLPMVPDAMGVIGRGAGGFVGILTGAVDCLKPSPPMATPKMINDQQARDKGRSSP